MNYADELLLAPESDLLQAYQRKQIGWEEYEQRYLAAIIARDVENRLDRGLFEQGVVLLCSESRPDRCHRRLAAEYLAGRWGGVTISHL